MQADDEGDTPLKIMALLSRAEAILIGFPGFKAPPPVPHDVHTSPGVCSRQAIAYARVSDVVGSLCAALTAHLLAPSANDPIHVPRGKRGWWARLGWMLASDQAQDIADQARDRAGSVTTLISASSHVLLALEQAREMAHRHGHCHMTPLLAASCASISLALDKLRAQGDGLQACQRMATTTRDLATAAHQSI